MITTRGLVTKKKKKKKGDRQAEKVTDTKTFFVMKPSISDLHVCFVYHSSTITLGMAFLTFRLSEAHFKKISF